MTKPYAEQDLHRLRMERDVAHQEAAELRKQIAREIEAALFDLSGEWVDGDLVIDGRTYRLTKQIAQTVNAVRLSDAAIARGQS